MRHQVLRSSSCNWMHGYIHYQKMLMKQDGVAIYMPIRSIGSSEKIIKASAHKRHRVLMKFEKKSGIWRSDAFWRAIKELPLLLPIKEFLVFLSHISFLLLLLLLAPLLQHSDFPSNTFRRRFRFISRAAFRRKTSSIVPPLSNWWYLWLDYVSPIIIKWRRETKVSHTCPPY